MVADIPHKKYIVEFVVQNDLNASYSRSKLKTRNQVEKK